MNILVTGGAGYVGSVLIPELVKDNNFVKCLDVFSTGINHFSNRRFFNKIKLIKHDIRDFDAKELNGVNVVIDMAVLSRSSNTYDSKKTFEINHKGRVRVAKLSKKHGVKQYILASSASVYGQQDEIVNEESVVKPLTAYSRANRNAEIDVLQLNDENFSVTSLRFPSIFGKSPRMRWDTSLHSMVLDLYKTGKITVRGQGNKRPFIHVKDAVRAYQAIIKAPKEKISGQIFNVGSDDQNYEMRKLAKEIANAIGEKCEIELGDAHDDSSYFASFKKIKETLGFIPKFNARDGILEIYQALKNGSLSSV